MNITTTCGHKFHLNCLDQWCKTTQSKRDRNERENEPLTPFTCPMCRQPIEETCKEAIRRRDLDEDEEAFLDYLEDTRGYMNLHPKVKLKVKWNNENSGKEMI